MMAEGTPTAADEAALEKVAADAIGVSLFAIKDLAVSFLAAVNTTIGNTTSTRRGVLIDGDNQAGREAKNSFRNNAEEEQTGGSVGDNVFHGLASIGPRRRRRLATFSWVVTFVVVGSTDEMVAVNDVGGNALNASLPFSEALALAVQTTLQDASFLALLQSSLPTAVSALTNVVVVGSTPPPTPSPSLTGGASGAGPPAVASTTLFMVSAAIAALLLCGGAAFCWKQRGALSAKRAAPFSVFARKNPLASDAADEAAAAAAADEATWGGMLTFMNAHGGHAVARLLEDVDPEGTGKFDAAMLRDCLSRAGVAADDELPSLEALQGVVDRAGPDADGKIDDQRFFAAVFWHRRDSLQGDEEEKSEPPSPLRSKASGGALGGGSGGGHAATAAKQRQRRPSPRRRRPQGSPEAPAGRPRPPDGREEDGGGANPSVEVWAVTQHRGSLDLEERLSQERRRRAAELASRGDTEEEAEEGDDDVEEEEEEEEEEDDDDDDDDDVSESTEEEERNERGKTSVAPNGSPAMFGPAGIFLARLRPPPSELPGSTEWPRDAGSAMGALELAAAASEAPSAADDAVLLSARVAAALASPPPPPPPPAAANAAAAAAEAEKTAGVQAAAAPRSRSSSDEAAAAAAAFLASGTGTSPKPKDGGPLPHPPSSRLAARVASAHHHLLAVQAPDQPFSWSGGRGRGGGRFAPRTWGGRGGGRGGGALWRELRDTAPDRRERSSSSSRQAFADTHAHAAAPAAAGSTAAGSTAAGSAGTRGPAAAMTMPTARSNSTTRGGPAAAVAVDGNEGCTRPSGEGASPVGERRERGGKDEPGSRFGGRVLGAPLTEEWVSESI